jgi:hypothetical protein
MIERTTEQLLRLIDLPDVLPSRPALSTVRRWASDGIDGVVLETMRLGGRRYTSHEAITRFLDRLNEMEQTRVKEPPSTMESPDTDGMAEADEGYIG